MACSGGNALQTVGTAEQQLEERQGSVFAAWRLKLHNNLSSLLASCLLIQARHTVFLEHLTRSLHLPYRVLPTVRNLFQSPPGNFWSPLRKLVPSFLKANGHFFLYQFYCTLISCLYVCIIFFYEIRSPCRFEDCVINSILSPTLPALYFVYKCPNIWWLME